MSKMGEMDIMVAEVVKMVKRQGYDFNEAVGEVSNEWALDHDETMFLHHAAFIENLNEG